MVDLWFLSSSFDLSRPSDHFLLEISFLLSFVMSFSFPKPNKSPEAWLRPSSPISLKKPVYSVPAPIFAQQSAGIFTKMEEKKLTLISGFFSLFGCSFSAQRRRTSRTTDSMIVFFDNFPPLQPSNPRISQILLRIEYRSSYARDQTWVCSHWCRSWLCLKWIRLSFRQDLDIMLSHRSVFLFF